MFWPPTCFAYSLWLRNDAEPSWAVVPREPAKITNLKQSKQRLVILSTADARIEWNLATGTWRMVDRHDLEIFSAPAASTVREGEVAAPCQLAERESIFRASANRRAPKTSGD